MLKTDRQKTLLLLFLVILAVLLIAPSLTDLQLQPGQPLPPGVNEQPLTQEASPSTTFEPAAYSVLKGFLSLLFVLITLYLFFNLILHLDWKHSIRAVLILIAIAALIIAIPRPSLDLSPNQNTNPMGIPTQANPEYLPSPLGSPPQALVWVVVVGLAAIGTLGLAWWLTRKRHPLPAVDPIGAQAFSALHALESGEDLNNVIMRCYLEMSRILQQEQGLERPETMTAAEFEEFLTLRGIPEGPVRQLTRLFEKARYSDLQLDAHDNEMGWNCLTAISTFFRQGEKNGSV
ncbi:MAG TPA: DUF4129 domain-containing protein [Longilinea sp.]|nr:DUF4129 domain-containing protein [Longilinea sp.]